MEIQIKSQKEFPLLERYKKVFNIDEKTIFAYNYTIYLDGILTKDLYIHEKTHIAQQERDGLEYWVENYLENPEYRLKQEIEAYQKQLKSIKDREHRNKVAIFSAKTLASPLYGNIITFEEAFNKIKK